MSTDRLGQGIEECPLEFATLAISDRCAPDFPSESSRRFGLLFPPVSGDAMSFVAAFFFDFLRRGVRDGRPAGAHARGVLGAGLLALAGSASAAADSPNAPTVPTISTVSTAPAADALSAASVGASFPQPVTLRIGRMNGPADLDSSLDEPMLLFSDFFSDRVSIEWVEIPAADAADTLKRERPDFVLAYPSFATDAGTAGITLHQVAARKTAYAESAGHSIGTALVVLDARRNLRTLKDLKGKRLAADLPESITELALLDRVRESGEDPWHYFSEIIHLSAAYPNAVAAVLGGGVDAAALPTCLLESLERSGLVAPGLLRVVDGVLDEHLACRRTSALFPDVSLYAFDWTPEPVVRDTTLALLSPPAPTTVAAAGTSGMSGTAGRTGPFSHAIVPSSLPVMTSSQGADGAAEGEATNATNAANSGNSSYGWVAFSPGEDLTRLYRSLGAGPYKYLREYSPSALYERYGTYVNAALLLLLLLVVNEIRLRRLVSVRTQSLRQALADRARLEVEARQARARLSGLEKRTIVNQMSGMIAHEIRSPVGSIRNFAAVLKLLLARDGNTNADIRTALDGIDGEALRIAGIVDRVRRYAKSQHGAQVPCDLVDIARRALRALDLSKTDHVPVVLDLPERAPVKGDPLELELLMLNLIKNAAEACAESPDAKVVLSLTAISPEDDPAGCARIRLTVEDNGPELSDAGFERLTAGFDSVKPEGLGLGLGIVRGIADSHSATIKFRRRPGGGVVVDVVFEMPVENEEADDADDADDTADTDESNTAPATDAPNSSAADAVSPPGDEPPRRA